MHLSKTAIAAAVMASLFVGLSARAEIPKPAGDTGVRPLKGDTGVKPANGDTGIKPLKGDTGVKPLNGDAPVKPAADGKAIPLAKAPDLTENLFPIELIIKAAPQIGLSETTMGQIRTVMQELRGKMELAQQTLRADTLALNDLLKQDKPDPQDCLAQLDRVLDDERAIKRLNMEASLRVRGLLSPDQIAKLKEFRDQQITAKGDGKVTTPPAGGPPEALRAKMQQVQTLAQQRQQNGQDVSAVRPLMQTAKTAAGNGDYKAAEDALDEALKLLGK